MKITIKQMMKLFKDHGMADNDYQDFFAEFGTKEMYRLLDVKRFLGY